MRDARCKRIVLSKQSFFDHVRLDCSFALDWIDTLSLGSVSVISF